MEEKTKNLVEVFYIVKKTHISIRVSYTGYPNPKLTLTHLNSKYALNPIQLHVFIPLLTKKFISGSVMTFDL